MNIVNKKAKFNYKLLERCEAGVVLLGAEAKALRSGNVDLSNSHAKVIEGEMFLINANIPVVGKKDYNPTRSRKLLLHKSEIITLKTKIKAKGLTLVPTKVYTKGHLVKVEIALAKSKRTNQKKEAKKKRDIERDTERELRGKKDNDNRR